MSRLTSASCGVRGAACRVRAMCACGSPRRASQLWVVAIIAVVLAPLPASAQPVPPDAWVARFAQQFQQAVAAGDIEAYQGLVAPNGNRAAVLSAAERLLRPRATRVAVKEYEPACDRGTCRLVLDVLCEFGVEASLGTWRIDLRQTGDVWLIVDQQPLTTIAGLFKLSLDRTKAYSARGVTVEGEDLRVQMTEGSVFVAEAAGRPTGFVFVGKGDVTFAPLPATERGQVRIFSGSEQMQAAVDALFIRVNPNDVATRIKGLGERQPDLRDLKRAEEIFRENYPRSFAIDLPDLSPDVWSLTPREGDFLSELYTKRYGPLTYAMTPAEPEDIVLFDRKARRNIAQYTSRARSASRGPFYDDGDQREFDVIDYDIDARFAPDRDWLEAHVRMSIVVRAPSVTSLTLRLDDGLVIRQVTSPELGRLLPLKVRGRNTVVVTLPATVTRGTRLTLSFAYNGTARSQRLDRDVVSAAADQQEQQATDAQRPPIEPSYLYSNRPFWYPQTPAGGYYTATLQLAVPVPLTVVASGERVPQPGDDKFDPAPDERGYRRYVFAANQPVRYLSAIIAPLVHVKSGRLQLGADLHGAERRAAGAYYDGVELNLRTNPREKGLGGDLFNRVSDILRFYAKLVGDCPYPALNIALLEQELPGGHSPAYVAAVSYVSPRAGVSWKADPAYSAGFPEYFLAHELAHQWWGQAVGWRNYHEQWLSEGFAQYFAALYAEHARGSDLFQDILRQWQRWAAEKSDQGPVYLGYRVGHIKGDSRVFRAVVYNKSALVLHMLRRVVGDAAFFRGLRRFYGDWRFRNAGTDDLQRAMEAEAGTSLQRFFDCWIYGDALPRVRAVTTTDARGAGGELVVRFRQEGTVFDVPVTVSLDYVDRPPAVVTVRLVEPQQEFRIPLAGQLRKVDLNRLDVAPFSEFVVVSPPSAPLAAARGFRPR
jgi:hypothetical protein